MSKDFDTSSIQRILRFPFQGPDWQTRFLTGAALSFLNIVVPFIPGIFIIGYLFEVQKRAIDGEPLELPAWDDWRRLGWTGMRGAALVSAFLLPALGVMLVGLIFYISRFFSLMQHPGPELQSVIPYQYILGIAVYIVSMYIGMGLGVIGGGLLPFAGAHFVAHDRLSAGFEIRAWGRLIWTNRWGYFLAWVVTMGVFFVLYFCVMSLSMTIFLVFVIPLLLPVIGFYVGIVGAAMFGATYRQSRDALDENGK